ncbi:MAG: M23 family metallopeptidase [Caedimonadaceae bacterium]|nr:MAG: M23 family metallopeptidase [Caedimonadaceae bacterium]
MKKLNLRQIAGCVSIFTAFTLAILYYLAQTPSTPLSEKVVEQQVCPEPTPSVEGLGELVEDKVVQKSIHLKSGDTIITALVNFGLEKLTAQKIADALKREFNPKLLRPEHALLLTYIDAKSKGEIVFQSLFIKDSIDTEITVSQSEDGTFIAKKIQKKLIKTVQKAHGKIESSLSAAARKAKIPHKIVHEMISSLSYDIDFQHDFHSGNSFGIIYEADVNPDTMEQLPKNLLYVTVQLKDRTVALYKFHSKGGYSAFYNPKGESIKKGLLRTPIDGAKISSTFGSRKHPILGYTRQHKGVDFSAPSGTPIMAAGDGTIEKAARSGGYGNYVRIKHNNEYSTAYAHLSRFAKSITAGKRVKQGQIIGYVGSTGLSSGPHLHYELIRFNQQINPNKVKMLPANKLSGVDLKNFQIFKSNLEKQFSEFVKTQPKI